MEGESSPVKSFETETYSTGCLLILLLMAALIDPGVTSHNPHRPAKITWKLRDGQTHEQTPRDLRNPPSEYLVAGLVL